MSYPVLGHLREIGTQMVVYESARHDSVYAVTCRSREWTILRLIPQGAPGKCEIHELFMDEYFNMIYLQTSILNHHTFLFLFVQSYQSPSYFHYIMFLIVPVLTYP